MRTLNIATLKVGDQVAVARPGSQMTHSEGIYTVVKVNKVRIVVQRDSDGYERNFSAKSGRELNKSFEAYRCPYLEHVSEQTTRNARLQHERNVKEVWSAIEQAAASKNIRKFDEAVAALKKLLAQS